MGHRVSSIVSDVLAFQMVFQVQFTHKILQIESRINRHSLKIIILIRHEHIEAKRKEMISFVAQSQLKAKNLKKILCIDLKNTDTTKTRKWKCFLGK